MKYTTKLDIVFQEYIFNIIEFLNYKITIFTIDV